MATTSRGQKQEHEHRWVPIRKGYPQRLCHCGLMKVGTRTVLLGDLIRYSTTKVPTMLGEIGMDVATGRPSFYADAAVRSMASLDDVQIRTPYIFTFPGVLNTTTNNDIPRIAKKIAHKVIELELIIHTAPTGADVIVTFSRGALSTGAIAGTIGVITLPAGNFNATLAVDVAIAATEFVVPTVDQVGSSVAGRTMTMIAKTGMP